MDEVTTKSAAGDVATSGVGVDSSQNTSLKRNSSGTLDYPPSRNVSYGAISKTDYENLMKQKGSLDIANFSALMARSELERNNPAKESIPQMPKSARIVCKDSPREDELPHSSSHPRERLSPQHVPHPVQPATTLLSLFSFLFLSSSHFIYR